MLMITALCLMMLRFKNAREIQARVNAFNRIVDSLKGQVPDWIIKELETAQILECDYEEKEV